MSSVQLAEEGCRDVQGVEKTNELADSNQQVTGTHRISLGLNICNRSLFRKKSEMLI